MYDYGWRQYMPDIGRWMQLDPLVEDTEDPYSYVFNNPIKLTDPDGRAPDDGNEECCSGLKGFGLSVMDNITGGNLAQKYNDGSSAYNKGVSNGNMASGVAGALLAVSGAGDIGAGGATLAVSEVATVSVVGAEIGVPGMAVSGGLILTGTAKVGLGTWMMSNASKNMKSNGDSGSSSNSDSSKRSNPKKEAREAGRANRENQPASEKRAKDYGKQLEKEQGKDARRKAHDAKDQIGKDRTVKELKEDYKRK